MLIFFLIGLVIAKIFGGTAGFIYFVIFFVYHYFIGRSDSKSRNHDTSDLMDGGDDD